MSTVAKKTTFYPADDIRTPKPHRKIQKPSKLRSSITPGTVLIILSGRFRGKRVVFLKQLASGLLLVTGPYKINGVPLRRINQAYVIATSTKVDVSGCKVDGVDDAFFKAEISEKKKLSAAERVAFFAEKRQKNTISASRVSAQKSVDAAIVKSVQKVPLLAAYLNTSFSLSKGQLPHEMKF
ncbi:60S ribosomal protein L6 [Nowakowskiella sp. JEL0407]|nr:60S ribosomal protein L6 [Nowakowskiella sp. JEL0407]